MERADDSKKLRLGNRTAAWVGTKTLKEQLRIRGIPPGQMKWEGIDRWGAIWKGAWKPKVPTKWNETFFFTMHQALWVGERAQKTGWTGMKWECGDCGVLETHEHLLWECKRAEMVRGWSLGRWTTLEEMLQDHRKEQRRVIATIWATRCQDRIEGKELEEERVKGVWKKKGEEASAAD